MAYLIHVQTKDGDSPQGKEWEWVARAFGEQGPELADRLVATVRAWDRHIRAKDNDQHADPVLTVHPVGTPDDALPPRRRPGQAALPLGVPVAGS
ncbi:hypothetical protein [Streptomyces griseoviridis]|uniref:Uncharacterized protein n=1 Tax=Streptomyces griseoviridis TaxID=45398 RepID=A0ABT9LS14_STRGD|nr:hypothetical protein [Streptomyces griseoviridis]MDP9686336.1 hypothetical protein [Streptomyces griseoviridis]GGT23253.1 hypothetical protein GCM10010240_64870 [Streptomyces griseoviridis]